jgi:hypothetical protein
MQFNQETRKRVTDMHIFLHKAERLLADSADGDDFVKKVFDTFENKPQFLSNEECEELLLEVWKAHTEGRFD